MHNLNIRVSKIKKYTKLVDDLYKNSLNNILNSNINNIMAKIVHIKLKLLKQSAPITQLCILHNDNILQLLNDSK